jgi:hypothetical protein
MMRDWREIQEKRDQGLYPCKAKGCKNFGNTASHKYQGIVCGDHAAISPLGVL